MSIERLVVVGASLAGLRAVEAARRTGFTGSITLIGLENHLPYDRPPLSKAFLEALPEEAEPAAPYFRDSAYLSEELAVDVLLGQPATALDVERRIVTVGGHCEVPYDALVIATGASAREMAGTQHLAGVYALRTLDDATAVRAGLESGARTVVIGAGFIGSEVASIAKKRGLDITIVEAMPTPLVRAAGTHMGRAIASLHDRNGTTLLCGSGVASIEGNDKVERVLLEDGTVIPADLVVVGIGVAPNTDWLQGSGLTIDNGIVCDETLWTGVPGVYAAGDVANWVNPQLEIRHRTENWTAAAEQGAAAAVNALDPATAKPYGTVPYFWSDWYDVRIQFVGRPDADDVCLLEDRLDTGGRLVALYRRGDALAGALTINGQTEIMKYRGMIKQGVGWDAALEHGLRRRDLAAAKAAVVAPVT